MPAAVAPRPSVSVVIPTHSEKRWSSLVRTVESVRAQDYRPAEIVVVVDHNDAMVRRVRDEIAGVTVLANDYARGASGNRNTGAFHTDTELIAFLDDDTAACDGWLTAMVAPFVDPAVVGTGGGIEGAWEGIRPRWMPDEFLWTVGISYTGMPTQTAPIRNVWSANMIVRRDAFLAVGGFRAGFGKLGDQNRPEDTDLCLRMSAGGGRWMYVPDAVIRHQIPVDRTTFKFFLLRCYAEGRGKVQMANLLDSNSQDLDAEKDYLRHTLPRAVTRNLADARRGRSVAHALKAGTVLAGVGAAGFGGAVESLASLQTKRRTGAL